jgi:hypothetical protein
MSRRQFERLQVIEECLAWALVFLLLALTAATVRSLWERQAQVQDPNPAMPAVLIDDADELSTPGQFAADHERKP